MAKSFTVFTYGTLMKGFNGNKKLMQSAVFLGNATINGTMHQVQESFPVVIANDISSNKVFGELYLIDEHTMKKLRKYEGVGSILTCYTEKVIRTNTDNGTTIARAFVAAPNLSLPIKLTSRKIISGNWRQKTTPPQDRIRKIPRPLWVIVTAGILMGIVWQVGIS